MSSLASGQSEDFSTWLDAYVAGMPELSGIPAPDAEARSLRAAAERFHSLSDVWSQQTPISTRSTTWEDLMAANSHTFPTRTSAPPRDAARRWETANRFVSVALVLALLVGIGSGAWLVANRGTGNDGPPSTGVPGLAQSGVATPAQQIATVASPTATTPIEELPGIQNAVQRNYMRQNQQPEIADLVAISVTAYQFDSLQNAFDSYGLLVQNQTSDFTIQAEINATTLVSESLNGPGDEANLVRIVADSESNYQVQQYVHVLDDTYVFVVMTVTGAPTTLNHDALYDSTAAAVNLATTLVENGQPSPDAARFYEDGTSTGGDWGFMPEAGDPLLLGLVPLHDQQLYPPDPSVEEASASYPPDPADLAGIVEALYRDYSPPGTVGPDGQFSTGATPMTDEMLATFRYSPVSISIYQLETPKDATVALDRLNRGYISTLADANQGGGQQLLVSEDLSGLGDKATRVKVTVTNSFGSSVSLATFEVIVVQRGEFVIIVYAQGRLGPVEEVPDLTGAPDPILDLATQIANEGTPSLEEATYAEDGSSTGGLWGFMPTTGDPHLMGLVPRMDQMLYPITSP